MAIEYRTVNDQEMRSSDDGRTVDGIGIVYDREVEIFPGFYEVIRKGAFKVDDKREVKSFFNHSPDMVLSTTKSDPPLVLEDTPGGVRFVSPIPPTTYGNDLIVNLRRGNVRGASFSFSIDKDGQTITEDKKGNYHREITKGTMYEIGPVTDPAYIQTKVKLRSKEDVELEFKDIIVRESKQKNENTQIDIDLCNKIIFNLEA